MNSLRDKVAPADYTFNFAMLGSSIIRNHFILTTFFMLDKDRELYYELKLEGRRNSKMVKKVPANISCRK